MIIGRKREEMDNKNKNARVRMEADRISNLPDEIIHLILSFNDTKYAVQTSVLSSRWKLIWKTLPYINLGDFPTLPKFSKFVNRLLLFRNQQVEISSVSLCFWGRANQKFVEKLASYVVSHNVKKVDILVTEFKRKGDVKLPLCFFNSHSLEHLRVEILDYPCLYSLPQSPWNSPSLTNVELTNVWLCPENTMCLDMFSKCVNLMYLTLTDCDAHELKVMKFMCPRLVHLSISRCWLDKIKILAPNLSYFCYDGWEPLLLSTKGLHSLKKVKLNTGTYHTCTDAMQRVTQEFMNMLSELRSAEIVILHGSVTEFLSKVLHLLEHQPSPFYNLKCLKIEGLERPKKRAKSDMTNAVINYFLNSSPTATVSKEFRKEMYANKSRVVNVVDREARLIAIENELEALIRDIRDLEAMIGIDGIQIELEKMKRQIRDLEAEARILLK